MMKRLIILAVVLIMALVVGPAFAGVHNTAGAKIDAPNLIKLSSSWSIGLEGGKDMANDLFYKAGDGVRYYEADKGYFAYVKVTYLGSLFDFSK